MSSIPFNPSSDIPSLAGRVFLVTGGTAGLGRLTVTHLAQHGPQHVLFTGRKETSAQETIDSARRLAPDTKVTFIKCDLASLESVKKATEDIKARVDRLDVVITNAGIMALPPALTVDGYELQFGTNHIGHAGLVKGLMPLLLRTAEQPGADARVIALTSLGNQIAPSEGIRFNELRETMNHGLGWSWRRYGQSKLANIMWQRELGARYPSLRTAAIHPGVIHTGLVDNLSLGQNLFVRLTGFGRTITEEEGVKNTLWAATTKDLERLGTGKMFEPVGKKGGEHAKASDKKLCAKLWEWTEEELNKAGIQ